MAIKYTTTNSIQASKQIKMLVYGRSGVGKTMLAATCPGVKIVRAEPGLLSLSAANQKRVFGVARELDVAEIYTIEDLEELYQTFINNPPQGEETIFVDSLTSIAEKLVASGKLVFTDPRQAYGDMADKIIQMIWRFCDLPNRHVVFICKECEEGKSGGEAIYGPKVPGKALGPDLPYQFDEVLRLGIGIHPEHGQYRFFQTQLTLEFAAKDRSGALDAQEQPNLTNIIRKIQNG